MSFGKPFTNQINQEIADVFRFYDTDGDGYLRVKEAINVWCKFGLNVEINTLKENKEKYELLEIVERLEIHSMATTTEEHFEQVFDIIDRRGNGLVSAEDIIMFLKEAGEEAEKRFVNDLCELIHLDSEDGITAAHSEGDHPHEKETPTFTAPEFAEWMQREYRRNNKL